MKHLPMIEDFVDGTYAVLKSEDILNECKDHGICFVSDELIIYSYLLDHPFLLELSSKVESLGEQGHWAFIKLATKEAIEKVLRLPNSTLLATNDNDGFVDVIDENLAAESLNELLTEARSKKVADLHIFVQNSGTIVKARIAGDVERFYNATRNKEYGMLLGGYIFGTKASEGAKGMFYPDEADDSTFAWKVEGRLCRYRVSTVPIKGGCKIVIRALDPFSDNIPLPSELGFLPSQVRCLLSLASAPYGGVLITGQTGSGKTTTLMSVLSLMPESRSVHTLEDPVEWINPKIAQTEINLSGDKDEFGVYVGSFADLGKRLLRQDIDVVMFGELRDKATADVFYRLASTGHLALGTMHTSSAVGVINSMIEYFGMNPIQVADKDAFTAFMHQKLANRVCSCAITHEQRKSDITLKLNTARENQEASDVFVFTKSLTELQLAERLFSDNIQQLRYRNPEGCVTCDFRGVLGKTVLAEFLMLDDKIRELIQLRNMAQVYEYLDRVKFPTVRDHALYAIKNGIIDIHEACSQISDMDNTNSNSFNYSSLNIELQRNN